MPRCFVVFEGGEGAGKTTQIALLGRFLTQRRIPYITTREPGGSPLAEKIRHLLVGEENFFTGDGVSEALLINAARRSHWQEVILPALQAEKWVICDRFYHSTLAYQGYGRGLDLEFLEKIHERAVDNALPDISFILDITTETAMKRIEKRRKSDHFEDESYDFYTSVREGFLKIAKEDPSRCTVINAEKSPEFIHEKVLYKLGSFLEK